LIDKSGHPEPSEPDEERRKTGAKFRYYLKIHKGGI
jgi:hypothetical protein